MVTRVGFEPALANSSIQSSGERDAAATLTTGFSNAFLVGSGIAQVSALLVLVLISNSDSREWAAVGSRASISRY